MRGLRFVPDKTNIDFFRMMRFWTGGLGDRGAGRRSGSSPFKGMNYGVDFRGGTLIMAATPEAHDVGRVPQRAEPSRASARRR